MEKVVNFLIPKHRKLSESEVKNLLEKYNLSDSSKLPRIKIQDPGLENIEIQAGDVVEISRKSFAGETKYFRVVIN